MDMALVKALVGSLTLTLFDELRLSFPLLQDGPSRKEALCCYLYDSISLKGDIIGLAIRDDVYFDFGTSFPIDPVAVIEDLYSNCPTPARALRFHKIRILFPLKSGHEAGFLACPCTGFHPKERVVLTVESVYEISVNTLRVSDVELSWQCTQYTTSIS
ncbi:hypothetical protein E2P81_ATG02530 [Venturia nashicola]|nr:hypothetical protein E2P81_ATG02530 [Venturia nashicola]